MLHAFIIQKMSYGIETKKLKRLVDFYSPFNNGQQLKFLTLFKGQQGLLRYLQTSSFQGIDSTSIQQRKSWFGSNTITTEQKKTIWQALLSPLQSLTFKIYLIISVLCLILQIICSVLLQHSLSYLPTLVNIIIFLIIYAVLVSIELSQFGDNKKLRKYALEEYIVKVWRDNEKIEISSRELVIGDVVEISNGDFVGADGIVIEGDAFVRENMAYEEIVVQKCNTKNCLRRRVLDQRKEDQFILRQLEVKEDDKMPSPIILAGSQVLSGDAKYVVLCVGKNSRLGHFNNQIHKSAVERKSQVQKKTNLIAFQITKFLILGFILYVILYIAKSLTFMIIQKNFSTQNCLKMLSQFSSGISLMLMGLPIEQIIGLSLGSLYIKLSIYKQDNIWYKYSKDCGTMRQITTIVLDNPENETMITLDMWWNNCQHAIDGDGDNSSKFSDNKNMGKGPQISQISSICADDDDAVCQLFERMFIRSLEAKDFDPADVGFKFNSFFIGRNQRFVGYLEQTLNNFAKTRYSKLTNFDQKMQHNQLHLQQSSQSLKPTIPSSKIQQIFIKGNSQTLLKQCTDILCPSTGKPISLSSCVRERVQQITYKLNIAQQPSLITGYIEVHPNHPKFREPGYKVVMISLISYRENHNNEDFQSLARMKNMGVSIMLLSNREHQETVALAKQMGIVIIDKPSIRLTGYDFYRIVNGIICKSCKKNICICTDQNKYVPSLKNQDQFNRIYKHLNVISQANSLQKQALAIGFKSANQKTCFFGASIADIPAMRASTIGATVVSQMADSYINSSSQIFLPNNKLPTIQKLINWSNLHYQFCRKYLIFAITPCIVAFITSFISYLLYDSHCIQLIQFIWVSVVICPILGGTLVLGYLPDNQNHQNGNKNDQIFIDKVTYRHISSQVVTQVLLIFLILFLGPSFIPEESDELDTLFSNNWKAKYSTPQNTTICSGIDNSIFQNNKQIYSQTFSSYGIYSRHLTFIFNLFVLMQIMNCINCYNLKLVLKRKEQNGFQTLTQKVLAKVGMLCCFGLGLGLQALAVSKGSTMFHVYPYGLTLKQWAISISLALIVILVGLIVSQIPYDIDNDQQNGKVWPNRCYNLAVMATVARQSLQDLQIDQQLQVKKMAMMNE